MPTWLAGFRELHLQLEADAKSEPLDWDVFLYGWETYTMIDREEIMFVWTDEAEFRKLEEHLRPLVGRGEGVRVDAVTYLRGMRPQ